jgi:cyclophilin family peptidyl-prolyl cis-trans isomerase
MSMEIQVERKYLIIGLITILAFFLFLGYKLINSTNNKVSGMVNVEMVTNKGTIVLELNGEKSPLTTENFLKYVNDGFYDGLIFHRVIEGFMIQGGGFEPGMKEKNTKYSPIKNEAKDSRLTNKRGTIAMARTNNPDSATSQFFINLADNNFLNPGGNDPYGYTVFGKVVKGMDVVDSIGKVKTHNLGMYGDVPIEDIVIETVKVVK